VLRKVGGVAMAAVPASHGAWLYHEYGPVKDVLKFEEISVPEVKPDQVLIKVKAAAINPVDYKRRTGYVSADSPFPVWHSAGMVSLHFADLSNRVAQ